MRFIASRWLRNKDLPAVAKFIRSQRPRDAGVQWEKVNQAQGLVFIAPVFWLGFPAILKGWFEAAGHVLLLMLHTPLETLRWR